MTDSFDPIREAFVTNVTAVNELVEFDRAIVEFAVQGLSDLADRLRNQSTVGERDVRNRIKAFKAIGTNDSLRPKYEAIFNQAVVLLVSYFGSVVHDIFRQALIEALSSSIPIPAAREELKVSFVTFEAQEATPRLFADLLVAQKEISFQDMQSISRAFQQNLEIKIEKTETVNDIIVGQAARHAIVHAAGVVDSRMLRQIAAAVPRSLKPTPKVGEIIRFQPAEVFSLGRGMEGYVEQLISSVREKLGEA